MSSLQGHFLVAAPHQAKPNLVEAVVLVVEHTDRGAFGVVLNSPWEEDDVPPGRRDHQPAHLDSAATFLGGPVTGPLMAVHTEALAGEIEILPGVFFSAKEENVHPVMQQTEQPYKIFTGYVEWGTGQLDDEVQQGIWRIVPATGEQIFSDGQDLWERLVRQALPLQLHDLFDPRHISTNPLFN
jgi:putative transcriptional regulator